MVDCGEDAIRIANANPRSDIPYVATRNFGSNRRLEDHSSNTWAADEQAPGRCLSEKWSQPKSNSPVYGLCELDRAPAISGVTTLSSRHSCRNKHAIGRARATRKTRRGALLNRSLPIC